ncbi:MAG: selenide, water dikinase SelD [Myxococcota bacterium]
MAATSADLVLVGAGHAHVQVLRRWMMAPVAGVRLSLVVDQPVAVYSGMVPGFVAGDYRAADLEIDAGPLARRAGARVILAAARSIDAAAKRIELEGRPPVSYDVASLDVGATVRGLDLPGVREHALATRPIATFVRELDARVAALSEQPRIHVVGGGAAGVELALTLQARLQSRGPKLSLISAGPLLAGTSPRLQRHAADLLRERGIATREGRVAAVGPGRIELTDGEAVETDLIVWATGAAPLSFPDGPGLPKDEAGFVRVTPELSVEGFPELFAAGDCAALPFAPWVRKAGVYAVRGGPVLDANLRARLRGGALQRYRPQRDFLALLNTGNREALGAKWGFTAQGARVWRLKDWIDRRFMDRFQVLDAQGRPRSSFPSAESMGMEEMECGGCAAKVGATPLAAALARLPKAPEDPSVRLGLAEPDDAAAFELPHGDVVLATIDAFRAFSDDPFTVGRVAAVNAVSDVLAKGGQPRHALALVNVPESDPVRAEELLFQVLSGVRAALDAEGITLLGGHTTQGEDLYVGLSVTGVPGDRLLPASGLQPGDRLVLTKPLGSGVLLAADMRGELPGPLLVALLAGLSRSNAAAARIALDMGARACTDISGFGLLGHLRELCEASDVAARVAAAEVPGWDGARDLLARGVRSTYHAENERARAGLVPTADPAPVDLALLFDPQTSGGLLFGVAEPALEGALRALHAAGDVHAACIGTVRAAQADGIRVEIAGSDS